MRLQFKSLQGEGSYSCKVACNHHQPSWRHVLATWLRRLAQRLDRRWSLAIELDSTAPLTVADEREVIKAGVEGMARHLAEISRTATVEQMLQRQCPEMFQDRA